MFFLLLLYGRNFQRKQSYPPPSIVQRQYVERRDFPKQNFLLMYADWCNCTFLHPKSISWHRACRCAPEPGSFCPTILPEPHTSARMLHLLLLWPRSFSKYSVVSCQSSVFS